MIKEQQPAQQFKHFRVRYIGDSGHCFVNRHIYLVIGIDKDGDYILKDEFLNETNHYKRFFEKIDEYEVLCQELEEFHYYCTGEYIESVDGFTYFTTYWTDSSKEEHKIYVKFQKVRNTIVSSIKCKSIDDFVLDTVKEEIVEVLKMIFK